MRKYSKLLIVLALAIFLSSCGIVVNDTTPPSGQLEKTEPTPEKVEKTEPILISQSKVDWFITAYNSIADKSITGIAEFNVKDKENGHYRTEFRLGAFRNAEAKTGKIGDVVIDIIAYGYSFKGGGYTNEHIRIYVSEISAEQAKEIIEISSPILDNNLPDADIEKVLHKVDENVDINGYYYGKICITWISGELMLKVE